MESKALADGLKRIQKTIFNQDLGVSTVLICQVNGDSLDTSVLERDHYYNDHGFSNNA
jgi:hypothetical protein